jgi:hypothetical protein
MLTSTVIPDFIGVRHLEDIQQRFFASAHVIMLQHRLAFRETFFDISALELYLKLHDQQDIWFDSATDSDEISEEQFNSATWYIRQKKGPAYWRIDITAGDKANHVQAGLLVRQLDGVGGPATALHRIVRGRFNRNRWTCDERNLITQIHGKRIDGSDGSPLVLKPRKVPLTRTLAKGKRIRLPSNDDRNSDGCSIREAALRIAIWKRFSADCRLDYALHDVGFSKG